MEDGHDVVVLVCILPSPTKMDGKDERNKKGEEEQIHKDWLVGTS